MTRKLRTIGKMVLSSLLLSTALAACTVGPDGTQPQVKPAPYSRRRPTHSRSAKRSVWRGSNGARQPPQRRDAVVYSIHFSALHLKGLCRCDGPSACTPTVLQEAGGSAVECRSGLIGARKHHPALKCSHDVKGSRFRFGAADPLC